MPEYIIPTHGLLVLSLMAWLWPNFLQWETINMLSAPLKWPLKSVRNSRRTNQRYSVKTAKIKRPILMIRLNKCYFGILAFVVPQRIIDIASDEIKPYLLAVNHDPDFSE